MSGKFAVIVAIVILLVAAGVAIYLLDVFAHWLAASLI